MTRFQTSLTALLAPLDPDTYRNAIARFRRCRRVSDMERIADTDLGWLEPEGENPRLRLVKHGSGTFLILSYDDGWGTTLSQQGFPR